MIVTVFRSRLRDEAREAYLALAPKISELAKSMPGYLSHKAFVAEDGERVTIVEFKDQESQRAWSTQIDHVAAKKQGREAFYTEYSIQVCEVLRESRCVVPD
ncbi:MAG: antibiotic biosynthesis monooxygenase [Burkholderiaceae bacterium]|nr:antibiotic biosynthesis monooxygenase [Roseateles sp.]MBV8468870.1 antibiotic biosynthesis monooxygenase [Burkholderiaceae bacterium]